ncbi:MAG: AAA family ATPase, partial [Proteobacteria bacterium]|nr:AAA family ATPase [Pseudomonadota bacterium]
MSATSPIPRILLAGLSGGAGKTIVSLGLIRAWTDAGHRVKPFKKGPDYIDANWLTLAARTPATNLDPCFLVGDQLRALYAEKANGFDVAVIEGNRGLFDGKDVEGSCSTAQLARQLKTPVVLILDCTKMTRTVAAVVAGCAAFEKGVDLRGVILNR